MVQGACPGPCFDVGRADEAEFPRDLGVGQRPCDSVWVVPRGVRGIGRRRPAVDEWICTLWQAGLTVSIHAQVVTNPADLAALSLKASNDVATVFRRSHWRSTSSARSASTPPAERECFDDPLGMILFGPCHFGHSLPTNRLSRHASSSSAGCRSEPLDAAVAQEVRACVLHSCFDAEGVAAVAGGSRWPRSSRASVERRAESSRSARTRSRTAVTGGALGTT